MIAAQETKKPNARIFGPLILSIQRLGSVCWFVGTAIRMFR